jgi:citrate lyase beta subunit
VERTQSFSYLSKASSRKFLQKTAGLNADSVIMDIEDGVAVNMKEEARNNLEWAVENLDFGKSELLV